VDIEEYPKKVALRTGVEVKLRPITARDSDLLVNFSFGLPEKERIFLRDDITNTQVIHSPGWNPAAGDAFSLIAFDGETVAGIARLQRYPFPWNRHMGNIRVTVSPGFRKMGLARILLGEVFSEALSSGIEKVIAEVVVGQEDAHKALKKLGFEEDTILAGHHIDPSGQKHDVLVMSSDLSQLWEKWRQYCESVSGTWHMED